MFTGIIQCAGRVAERRATEAEARLTIVPERPFEREQVGESVAVNGVCLTAERFEGGAFVAYASRETLGRTTLRDLRPGDAVNLERALAVGERMGGHMVSGHVDGIATVESVSPAGSSTRYRIGFSPDLGHLVVAKGSVALDGVSLTVNDCGRDFLTVNVIPETLKATTIGRWKQGSLLNMETDLIGKYVFQMLESRFGPQAAPASAITADFLREHGF